MALARTHSEVFELLGAYALDACDAEEAEAVEAHLAGCAECAADAAPLRESAAWLGSLAARTPPPGLRDAVLHPALAPGPGEPPATAASLYADVADTLDRVATSLAPDEWRAVGQAGWTCHEWVAHLLAGVSLLNRAAGVPGVDDPGRGVTEWVPRTELVQSGERTVDPLTTLARWREHADALRVHLAQLPAGGLDATIDVFGWPTSVRDAVTIHAFETWVHTDDIRRATGQPTEPPSARSLAVMTDLAVHVVAASVRGRGERRPFRVVLAGPGGGTWTVPFGSAAAAPACTVTAGVVDFCTLIGGRLAPDDLAHRFEGDAELAGALVRTAASFAFV